MKSRSTMNLLNTLRWPIRAAYGKIDRTGGHVRARGWDGGWFLWFWKPFLTRGRTR